MWSWCGMGRRALVAAALLLVVVVVSVECAAKTTGKDKKQHGSRSALGEKPRNDAGTIVDTAGMPGGRRGKHGNANPEPVPLSDEDLKYSVVFSNAPLDMDAVDRTKSSIVTMHSRDGKQHHCVIPPSVFDVTQDDVDGKVVTYPSLAHERYEYNQVIRQAIEDACLYRIEGWWTYEYCFGRSVRQYHASGENIEAEFFLGHADLFEPLQSSSVTAYVEHEKGQPSTGNVLQAFVSAEHKNPIPYFSLYYDDGTLCDLSRNPRKVEVRHFCTKPGKSYIEGVREPKSCEYVINVNIGALCDVPQFKIEVEHTDEVTIKCHRAPEVDPEANAEPASPPLSSTSESEDKIKKQH